MNFPERQNHDGAGAAKGAARGNKARTPLFGDRRWVRERLRALRAIMASGGRRATA
jgi:hypothetical protein